MANGKSPNTSIFEIIIVIVVGIAISYIFYLEVNGLTNKLVNMEDQISAIQTDIVKLRLQVNKLEAPKSAAPTTEEANPNPGTVQK
jgi:cell division protein FtsL